MIYNLAISTIVAALLSAGATWKVLDTRHTLEITQMENEAWQAHVASLDQKNTIDLYNTRVAQATAQVHQLKNRKREVVTEYVNNGVIEYVQDPSAGKCIFSAEWVRTFNAAASGRVPGDTSSAGKSDGTTADASDPG